MVDKAAVLDGEAFGRRFRWWIVLCGNGLALFLTLGWLVTNSLKFAEMPDVVRGLLLLSYALSWVVGTNFDLSAQRFAYYDSPIGPIPGWAFVLVLLLTLVGGLLILSRDNRYFATTLAVFYTINVLFWHLFQARMQMTAGRARQSVLQNHSDRIPLFDIVQRYVAGGWQRWRFAVMLVVIAAAVTTSYSTNAREFIAVRLHESIPSWSSPTISSYIPVACLAAFLLIAEGWVWLMRLGVYHTKQQVAIETESYANADSNAPTKKARKSGDKGDRVGRPAAHRLMWPKYLGAGHIAGVGLSSKILSSSDFLGHVYLKYCLFIFLIGFILAILSFVSLTIVHDHSLASHVPTIQFHQENSRAARKAWVDFGASTLLLVVGLALIAISL